MKIHSISNQKYYGNCNFVLSKRNTVNNSKFSFGMKFNKKRLDALEKALKEIFGPDCFKKIGDALNKSNMKIERDSNDMLLKLANARANSPKLPYNI